MHKGGGALYFQMELYLWLQSLFWDWLLTSNLEGRHVFFKKAFRDLQDTIKVRFTNMSHQKQWQQILFIKNAYFVRDNLLSLIYVDLPFFQPLSSKNYLLKMNHYIRLIPKCSDTETLSLYSRQEIVPVSLFMQFGIKRHILY